MKKGKELKTDMEVALLANKGSVVGTSAAARKTAGFAAWITTNDQRGATGTDGGFSGGTVTAGTPGTQRAFTKPFLDAAILSAYTAGGSPIGADGEPVCEDGVLVLHAMRQTRRSSSRVLSMRTKRPSTLRLTPIAVDFGLIDIMPNRQLARAGGTAAATCLPHRPR